MKEVPLSQGIPQGFGAVALGILGENAPLRLCVIRRKEPDAAAGPFVLLRDDLDARVYLGCITDVSGNVQGWAELWIQTNAPTEADLASHPEVFSNSGADQRWLKKYEQIRALSAEDLIVVGYERTNPPALFLDPKAGKLIQPVDPRTGGTWQLCSDDGLLAAADLPPYSGSRFRYLYQRSEPPRFLPVTPGAPESASTEPPGKALGESVALVPFNAHAGMLLVRKFYPIDAEEYLDLLSGQDWRGVSLGKQTFFVGDVYERIAEGARAEKTGSRFLTPPGPSRILEVLYLKLNLLLQMSVLAGRHLRHQQVPFLNLGPESFRVQLSDVGFALPAFWTAKCTLVKPSQASPLRVPESGQRYCVQMGRSAPSLYQAPIASRRMQGTADVRIRKVQPNEQGDLTIEGTLVTRYLRGVAPNDLLWLRLPLAQEDIDLYAHSQEGWTAGEVRFRTITRKYPEATTRSLLSANLISFPPCPFEVIPAASSPCDLYSLGVLAARALLAREVGNLSAVLDTLFSLANEIEGYDAALPLAKRVQQALGKIPALREELGPQHLAPAMRGDAGVVIPDELWSEVLAWVLSLFPGKVKGSICANFGDAPERGLHTVFDAANTVLQTLTVRLRQLLVSDPVANAEIQAVIQQVKRA